MLDFGLSKIDKLIVSGAVVGALAASYVLSKESILRQILGIDSGGRLEVGQVLSAKNDTRRRLGLSPVWYGVESDESLFERDSLFTGQNSEMQISLVDQGIVNLGPNSLIRLERFNNEISIDLQLGSATASLSRGQRLNLLQGGQKTTLRAGKDSQVTISRTEKGTIDLTSLSGVSSIEVDNKKTDINSNEKVQIEKNLDVKKESFDITATSPRGKSILWIEENEPIGLRWFDADADTTSYRVALAEDSQFRNIIKNMSAKDQAVGIRGLKLGQRYFWQVTSRDKSRKSQVTEFRLLRKKGPHPEHPFPEQKINVPPQKNKENVSFQWRHKLTAHTYQIQVSDKPDFSTIIEQKQTNQNYIEAIPLAKGEYFWRVRTTDVPALAEVWSEITPFTVGNPDKGVKLASTAEKLPDAPTAYNTGPIDLAAQNKVTLAERLADTPPKLAKPTVRKDVILHNLEFDKKILAREPANAEKAISNSVRLAWAGQPNQNHKLQISQSKQFDKPVFEKTVKGTKANWRGKPGNYYWRVIAKDGTASETSDLGKITVKLPAPEKLETKNNKIKVKNPDFLNKPGPELETSWAPVPMAQAYTAVITTVGESPKAIAEKTVDEPKANFPLAKSGKYAVRVAASSPDGKPQGPLSQPKEFNFKKELELDTPEVQVPADGVTVVSFGGSSSDPLIFGWDTIKHAKNYEVQYSRSSKFDKILFSKKVSSNQFVLTDKVKGVVFWRVRATRGGFKSNWSQPRFFELSSQ